MGGGKFPEASQEKAGKGREGADSSRQKQLPMESSRNEQSHHLLRGGEKSQDNWSLEGRGKILSSMAGAVRRGDYMMTGLPCSSLDFRLYL